MEHLGDLLRARGAFGGLLRDLRRLHRPPGLRHLLRPGAGQRHPGGAGRGQQRAQLRALRAFPGALPRAGRPHLPAQGHRPRPAQGARTAQAAGGLADHGRSSWPPTPPWTARPRRPGWPGSWSRWACAPPGSAWACPSAATWSTRTTSPWTGPWTGAGRSRAFQPGFSRRFRSAMIWSFCSRTLSFSSSALSFASMTRSFSSRAWAAIRA